MSQEPYTALYTAPLRLALRSMDDRLLRLFIALATYADQRGVCFPGVRELAAATGYSVELVIELLYQLEECDMLVYLRRNERDPVTRRQLPNVYMLTSALLVTRDTIEAALFTRPDPTLGEEPDRKLPSSPIRNQNQKIKDQEPAVEPAAEPPPQPPTASANVADSGSGAPKKQGKKQSRAGQDQKQPAQRPSEAKAPPPPPSREPSDLARYDKPLDVAAERVAEDMRSMAGNMTHANARMLVDVYGAANARAAVILYTLQPKNSIPNPAGYIRALLRRHAVSAADIDPPAPGAATTQPEQELSY
jgi:hypothetical protein